LAVTAKRTRIVARGGRAFALAAVLAGSGPGTATGSVFTVNSTSDAVDANPGDGVALTAGGVTTLRAAVQEANALAGVDVIDLPAGTYLLTIAGAGENAAATGDLDITASATITGAGSVGTIIDAAGLDRVLEVLNASTVALRGVTLRGGVTASDGGGLYVNSGATVTVATAILTANSAGSGGAVRNQGNLTLDQVRLMGNAAGVHGGGFYNDGTAIVTKSLIDSNSAQHGGGVRVLASATLVVTNTTVSGNSASSGNGGGFNVNGSLTLTNVTISGNTASGSGGGVHRANGGGPNVSLRNTVISGNAAPTGPDFNNGASSLGSNIVGNTSGSSGWVVSDLQNVDPLLDPLADNGGVTLTHALQAGSPAIDAGTASGAPGDDQRGVSRPQGAGFDIGAFEVVSATIDGRVFEDVNYGGGAGQNWVTASGGGGSARAAARVELFDGAGGFVTSTTTDGSGVYSFAGLPPGDYTVRVVSASVTSSRTGYVAGVLPVQTLRTSASTGTAVDVMDHVGGHDPATVDAGNASAGWILNTTTGVFSGSGSGKAHAFAPVTVSTANVTGVDFGWNFDAIVNTNGSGQGSLRQALTNANTLGGDASLAQIGRPAGVENAIFMISNGTAAPGLRAANNYFVGAVATIGPSSPLPAISASMVLSAQNQPGWTSAPIVELNGTGAGAGANGLLISAGNVTVRGLIVNRFSASGIQISGTSAVVAGNWLGLDATGTLDRGNAVDGVTISADSATIGGSGAADRNVLSGNDDEGVDVDAGIAGVVIQGNYIGTNSAGTAAVGNGGGGNPLGGILAEGTGTRIGGSLPNEWNLISGNGNHGIYLTATGNIIEANRIGTDFSGTAAIANTGAGIVVLTAFGGANNTIGGLAAAQGNTIAFNTGDGIRLAVGAGTGNALAGNATFSNAGLGIDLNDDGVTANDGIKSAGQPNLLMDFPVFAAAALSGTTLTVAGYVGSAPGQALFSSARVEVFESDSDGSGFGEGRTYLGFLTADASGNFAGAIDVSGKGLVVGEEITGTATDASGNTSEFGAAVAVVSGVPFLVDTANDVADGATTSIVALLADKGPDGVISLREAITACNNTPNGAGPDTIRFDIPGPGPHTISATTALPTLTGPVLIDGASEPDFVNDPVIEIEGSGAPAFTPGFSLTDSASTIRGFAINRFHYGVLVGGLGGHVVQGNRIGTDVTGTLARPNLSTGVTVSSANNMIGGSGPGEGNTISGNNTGVVLSGAGVSGNQLLGNYIGVTASGGAVLPNANQGVLISSGANGNTVGGTGAGVANVISGNGSAGVHMTGSGTTSNLLQGNLIGTDVTGALGRGNSGHGVTIDNGASGNTIGGTAPGERNVISGNGATGVYLSGTTTDGNVVQGNYVGLNALGSAAIANQTGISLQGSINTLIGGAVGGAGNVISGNTFYGLAIGNTGTTGIQVQGNLIGLDATGSVDLGNGWIGVLVNSGAAGNTIGGTVPEARNIISGNDQHGVMLDQAGTSTNAVIGNYIGTDSTGTSALGNAFHGVAIQGGAGNNTIGGVATGARNVISGNALSGVQISGAGSSGNTIAGNIIGLDVSGSVDLGNASYGIYVASGAANNTIGGTLPAARNVIAGNNGTGILIMGAGTTGTLVQGNYIGTDITGGLGRGNGSFGVMIDNAATSNSVGGSAAGAGNVISGNLSHGVYLTSGGNTVQGNVIGLTATGAAALGNAVGVLITSASNVIGGTSASTRNVISGNQQVGIVLSGVTVTGNVVQGNLLGTDITGSVDLGNGQNGVNILSGASNNTIGGTSPGAWNVISGNDHNGVLIDQAGTSNNMLVGNYIGTDSTGTSALGNTLSGVLIQGSASSNTVGGLVAGARNVIANNGADGVAVVNNSLGNGILGNTIYSNGGLGTDLANDGVTANNGTTSGALPNGDMDRPVYTTAALAGTTLTVAGYVGSAPGQATFANSRVEVFKSDDDASGSGEGQTYLGFLTADASGNFGGSLTVSGLAVGDKITGTATDGANNTSEFGSNAIVTTAAPPAIVKRAFLLDGTPIMSGATLPRGTHVRFLLYVDNPAGAMTDVTVQDLLDPGFTYVPGSLWWDDSMSACPAGCGAAEEAALYSAIVVGTPGTDALDGDSVAFVADVIHAGDGTVGNARLDIPAGRVWGLVFTARVE
jgi:hypothetical protein